MCEGWEVDADLYKREQELARWSARLQREFAGLLGELRRREIIRIVETPWSPEQQTDPALLFALPRFVSPLDIEDAMTELLPTISREAEERR